MAKPNSPSLTRISGVYGLLAPIFAYVMILVAVASYSEFSWADSALSDLGVVPGITSSLFNGGLVISGVLFLTFTIGFFFFAGDNRVGRVGILILAVACAALVMIGVFPENVKPIHFGVSVAFFTLLPIALLAIAGSFWIAQKKSMALFTWIVALTAAVTWIFHFSFRVFAGVAIPEFVSGLAGAIWVASFGIRMIKDSLPREA